MLLCLVINASYLDWTLLSLNCFQLMMLKSIRCQLEETSGEFTLWFGHLLPNAFGSLDVRAKKQGVAADVCDILCLPAKLYSQTSRNLFPPSFCLCSHSSLINGFLLLRLPSVCSCLDGRCSNTSPSQIKRRLYNSRQHRTHKCNSRAQPLNLFWGHEEGAWIPHGCSRHKTWSQSVCGDGSW